MCLLSWHPLSSCFEGNERTQCSGKSILTAMKLWRWVMTRSELKWILSSEKGLLKCETGCVLLMGFVNETGPNRGHAFDTSLTPTKQFDFQLQLAKHMAISQTLKFWRPRFPKSEWISGKAPGHLGPWAGPPRSRLHLGFDVLALHRLGAGPLVGPVPQGLAAAAGREETLQPT